MAPCPSSLEMFVEIRYKKLLRSCSIVDNLIKLLSSKGEVFVFGGWVRDRIHECIHNERLFRRYIDVVVNGQIDEQDFVKAENNKFWGGFKINKKRKIDFWQLDKTLAFRKKIFKPSIENLLRSTVFTVNSVVFDTRLFPPIVEP